MRVDRLGQRRTVELLAVLELQGHHARAPAGSFLADVIAGLSSQPKRLSPKYFYDATGSELFEAITRLPEYYPTRTELGILRAHAGDMAAWIGPHARIIEFGSGSGDKTRRSDRKSVV